jgi:hypothetical protein
MFLVDGVIIRRYLQLKCLTLGSILERYLAIYDYFTLASSSPLNLTHELGLNFASIAIQDAYCSVDLKSLADSRCRFDGKPSPCLQQGEPCLSHALSLTSEARSAMSKP